MRVVTFGFQTWGFRTLQAVPDGVERRAAEFSFATPRAWRLPEQPDLIRQRK